MKAQPIPLPIRRQIWERSMRICERCNQTPSVHIHHRQLRSQGGKHTLANLVDLCLPCHDEIHREPAEAYASGWLVRGSADPALIALVPLSSAT